LEGDVASLEFFGVFGERPTKLKRLFSFCTMMMMMMKQLERKSAAELRRRRHGRAAAVMAARWVFSLSAANAEGPCETLNSDEVYTNVT
jgi:hypothetical protein